MKKLSFLTMLLAILSCNQNKGWTVQDEQQFLGGCVINAQKDMNVEKARSYCTCMLQKIKARYVNAAETRYMKQDSVVYRFGRECLQP
jgi:hypothetical protein